MSTTTNATHYFVDFGSFSAYERIITKRNLERRLPCRRRHDGAACVLDPLHDDWHQGADGCRWP